MKTNLFVALLISLFAYPLAAQAQGLLDADEPTVYSGPAAPSLDVGNLVDAIEGEWSPHGFVTRMKSGANGVIIGEVQKVVLVVNHKLETLPPKKMLPILVTPIDAGVAKTDPLRLMTCEEASPYKAGEKGKRNGKWDKAEPSSCLVKIKFTKKGSNFFMDATLANLAEAGGTSPEEFLMRHYKMSRENAKRFSPTAPLFLNTEFLREGLIDPFISKKNGQFESNGEEEEPGTSKMTAGKAAYAILWVIAMVLIGFSLTWVARKARHELTGSAELGKLDKALIALGAAILGGLMVWLGWWGLIPIGYGLGGFLTFLKITLEGREYRKAGIVKAPAEPEEEED